MKISTFSKTQLQVIYGSALLESVLNVVNKGLLISRFDSVVDMWTAYNELFTTLPYVSIRYFLDRNK